MWELSNGSYYNWDKSGLTASIIKHNENDGANPNCYGLQIHTNDGRLLVIDYIKKDEFVDVLAKAICEAALRENKDYEWWVNNLYEWLYNHTVAVKS